MTRLTLLGDFGVQAPDAPPCRLGPKARALLACAALHDDTGVARSTLIALLWADQAQEDAQGALRQCLHQIRRALGEAVPLGGGRDHVALVDADWEIDVRRFEQLAACDDIAAALQAVALYRGDFVHGLGATADFERWAQIERERLRDVAQALLERISLAALTPAQSEPQLALARRLLAVDPLHEGGWRALMRLYVRAGLRAKALQAWEDCRRALRRELDAEPSAQTATLAGAVRAMPAPGLALAALPAQAPATTPVVLGRSVATRPNAIGHERAPEAVLDHLLRGWQLFAAFTAAGNAQARAAFESALQLAPTHGEALALLGWTHWFDSIAGWSDDAARSMGSAWRCARDARAQRQDSSAAIALMAKLHLWDDWAYDEALDAARQTVERAPGSAWAHFHLADVSMWCGRGEESLVHLGRALRLEPNDYGVFLTIQGLALWSMGDHAAAHAVLQRVLTRNPGYSWAHGALAAVLAERGELDAARAAARQARAYNRRMSVAYAEHVLPLRRDEDRARMARAWRAAGMPDAEAPAPREAAGAPAGATPGATRASALSPDGSAAG